MERNREKRYGQERKRKVKNDNKMQGKEREGTDRKYKEKE